MIRLYLVVEGPTEEQFAKALIVPHLAKLEVWTRPVIVTTSRDRSTGRKTKGGGRWSAWKRDFRTLLASDRDAAVRFSTLFDLYGLPADFPGVAPKQAGETPESRAQRLETEMAGDLGDSRLIPYLQVHEFETYIFVDLGRLEALLDPQDRPGLDTLRRSVAGLGPEEINEGATTAPSKRLLMHLPVYQKAVHGPLVTEAIGLDRIRAA